MLVFPLLSIRFTVLTSSIPKQIRDRGLGEVIRSWGQSLGY